MRVVISLHGMKTRGIWQNALVPELVLAGFVPYVLDYGKLGALHVARTGSLDAQVSWLVKEYDRITAETGCGRPSVIAHSFGTLQIGRLLQKYEHVNLDKLILAAAILPVKYPWAKMLERYRVAWVVNDYGGNDSWPKLARCLLRNAGESGAAGFRDTHRGLHQVEHPYHHHSDYFSQGNFRHHWIPTLRINKRSIVDDLYFLLGTLADKHGINRQGLRCSLLAEPQRSSGYLEVVAGLHLGDFIKGELDIAVRLNAVGVQGVPATAFNSAREVTLRYNDLGMLRESFGKAVPSHQDLRWALLLPVPSSADNRKCAGVLRVEGLEPPSPGLLEGGLIEDDTMNIVLRRLGVHMSAAT